MLLAHCITALPGQLAYQLDVLLTGGLFAGAAQAGPGIVFGNGFKVEAAGAVAGYVAIGGLLVEGVKLEQHHIAGLGGELLGTLAGGFKFGLRSHRERGKI